MKINGPLTRLEAANRTRASRRASAADRARLQAEDERAQAKRARARVEKELQKESIEVNSWLQITNKGIFLEAPVQVESVQERTELDAPVIGYRCWRVDNRGRLCSSNVDYGGWDDTGVNEAKCQYHGDHMAPAHSCQCGFYAWHTIEDALRMQMATLGAVLAWGRMEAHRTGFRAQYARIIAITSTYPGLGPSFEELEGMAKEFGEPIPEEHRYAA